MARAARVATGPLHRPSHTRQAVRVRVRVVRVNPNPNPNPKPNPKPNPYPNQAFKEELTQTALYIVDEVEARIKTHKDEVIARLHAQQVALEASDPNTPTRPQP